MISIVCYLWQGPRPFLPAYVNVLARMVAAHLPEPHRFICISDMAVGFSEDVEVIEMPAAARALGEIRTPEGDKFPSSYRRLWTFSQEARKLGERVLLLDIDCMIVSALARLFVPQGDFIGWRVRPPAGGPPRFGGGTWLHRTGTRTHVFEDFIADPAAAIARAREAGYRGSDQAWISYCLSEREPAWPEPSGIFCAQDYRNVRRPKLASGVYRRNRRRPLPPPPAIAPPLKVPPGAIILHMNGAEKPWNSDDVIVRQHWRPYLERRAACSA